MMRRADRRAQARYQASMRALERQRLARYRAGHAHLRDASARFAALARLIDRGPTSHEVAQAEAFLADIRDPQTSLPFKARQT